jgi:DNA-binding response OmpR family regulator
MSTTVLVVEDDLEINELLGEYLALEDMRYLKAATGQAGIHLAQAEHPDAIILDLMLPDVDGFAVARQLTAQRATFDMPIIVLTCMCHEADREKCFHCGALFFMTKPFLPDDLLATVRQALAWKASLPTREPAGAAWLGGAKDGVACTKAFHQMTADLFARTGLDDQEVAQVRRAMELLAEWARQWQGEHPGGAKVKVEYQITPDGRVEWTLTEERPGMLDEAFFKTSANGGSGGGWMGWGATTFFGKSEDTGAGTVPAKWGEILALTGAARFEKDTGARMVRWARAAGLNAVPASAGAVPVVEVGAAPAAARERDPALAANEK